MATGCLMGAAVCAALMPGSLNDLDKTPGAVRTTDKVTICGQHTGAVRNVSKSVRRRAFALYGITNKTGWCKPKGCEVDHLISLELGGSNDIKNLWPQPYAGIPWNAHVKDKIENHLHALICNGSITVKAAQQAIATDWIQAYKKYLAP